MLKAPIPDLVLFFDLEWVPDAHGARRLFGLEDEVTEVEAMQRLWEICPQYDSVKNPRPFLKYMFSRIVSIAFMSRKPVFRSGERAIEYTLNSLPKLPAAMADADESFMIEKFLRIVGERCPQLVGYNSADSDLQVLIQRGMINEISSPAFCKRPAKPWEGPDFFDSRNSEAHLDIAKRFSGGAMMPKLDQFAKLCGFPGKIDIKGDQVTDLWLAGDLDAIVKYNQIDVLNTYLVWLRMVYFCGQMSEEEYFVEQEGFRAFLQTEAAKEGNGFIGDFLVHWPE